jgi:UDP-2-acetamido-3-amino-2,3-dideoxy-glucuronate N-acetyltransferase
LILGACQRTGVGWRVVDLAHHVDPRGVLVPHEFADLPFRPQRVFVVTGAPPGTTRGGHAHRTAWQLLHCPSGSVAVEVRAEDTGAAVTLDRPERALVIEPGVWSRQTFETPAAVLLVLSSEPYDAGSYLDEPRR